jgi:hypothetical protein
MDEIVITNHGVCDVYNLNVEADLDAGLLARDVDDFPVPMLPAGKSVIASRFTHSGTSSYFTMTITGTTPPVVV